MRCLVTGAAGFIGSHITDRLLEDGHTVVALDNLSTGHSENLDHIKEKIEFVEGDIRDLETCKRVCNSVEWVFHQAALGSVPRSVADPLTSHHVNSTGTLNMLEASRAAHVQAFVYANSSSFFGNTPTLPKTDEMPANPLSPYSVTKATGEFYGRVFAALYDLPVVGLRYFNVFGPRQDPNGPYAAVIPKFINALMSGQSPTIHGDGRQTRDFTFISNVVDANILAAQNAKKAQGNIMNVACGGRTSLIEIHRLLNEIFGKNIEADFGPPRAGDVRDSEADISTVVDLLGFSPKVGLNEGLQKTVQWFIKKHEA